MDERVLERNGFLKVGEEYIMKLPKTIILGMDTLRCTLLEDRKVHIRPINCVVANEEELKLLLENLHSN